MKAEFSVVEVGDLTINGWVAVVAAFFILSEPITLASLIGGGVIILGVWLVNR